MAFLYGASLPNMAQRTATRLQPPIVVGRASMLPATDQMTLTQAIPTAPAVGRASMLPATDQMTLTQVAIYSTLSIWSMSLGQIPVL